MHGQQNIKISSINTDCRHSDFFVIFFRSSIQCTLHKHHVPLHCNSMLMCTNFISFNTSELKHMLQQKYRSVPPLTSAAGSGQLLSARSCHSASATNTQDGIPTVQLQYVLTKRHSPSLPRSCTNYSCIEPINLRFKHYSLLCL